LINAHVETLLANLARVKQKAKVSSAMKVKNAHKYSESNWILLHAFFTICFSAASRHLKYPLSLVDEPPVIWNCRQFVRAREPLLFTLSHTRAAPKSQ
jgi:hypothetical protein